MRSPSLVAACAPVMLLLATAAHVAGQQSDEEWLTECRRQADRSNDAVACLVKPVTAGLPGGALAVDAGRNGGIRVSGAAGAQGASGSARIQARAATEARAMQIAEGVRIQAAGGRLSAEGIETVDREHWSVLWALTVPQRTDLDLRAVNGPLAIHDVSGTIRARTTNGPLALAGVGGDVHARAVNGPLSVRLSGSRWEGAGLDAETRNGPVSLQVPEGYSAELHIGTKHGPFSARAPLTVTGSLRPGGEIRTTLGDGGAPIRVVTTNGPATFSRR